MIKVIYGAGGAKARDTLLSSLRAHAGAGERAILLVPEQETVSAERRMLRELPPRAQLTFEVLNFTRLANRVFRTVGGLCCQYATPAVSALTMWRVLRRLSATGVLGKYNNATAEDPRFCDRMLSAVTQFKAYRVEPEALESAAEGMDENDPLRQKIEDVSKIYAAYRGDITARFSDAADDLTRLAEALTLHGDALFGDTHVYVDSFTDFTAQEIAVLTALIDSAASFTFTTPLCRTSDDGLHLSAAVASHREILRIARERDKRISYVKADGEAPARALDYLGTHLWNMRATPVTPMIADGRTELTPVSLAPKRTKEEIAAAFALDGSLSLHTAATPYAEAEAAAAEIHRLTRAGVRYRDITVVYRDANDAVGIIDAAFEKEGIPCFLSEKTDITVRPLVKLILLALQIRRRGFAPEDVIGYLKTGLSGIPRDEIDLFEEYVNVWNLSGRHAYAEPFTRKADGYSEKESSRGAAVFDAAERVRATFYPPLSDFFDAMEAAKTAGDQCRALYDFLLALSVPDRLREQAAARLDAGERREADELARLWNVTVDAINAISDTLGGEETDDVQFIDALKLVFSRTDIGSIPTSADEVTIGSASMLRADRPRYVLALGLNESVFPRNVADDGLFSDAEKKRLAERDVVLCGDRATAASDELFFIYRTFTAPETALWCSYSLSDPSGHALTPSLAVGRLHALFPQLPLTAFESLPPLSRVFTESGATEVLPLLSATEREAVLSLLRDRAFTTAAHLDTPIIDPAAAIREETAAKLFGKHSVSASELESFSSCRFRYYCKYVLQLREEQTDELSLQDTGIFIHYVLEHVMKETQKSGKPFSAYREQEIKAIVARFFSDYRNRLTRANGDLSPRAEALVARLYSLAELIVIGLFAEFSDSDFTPAFFELNFRSLDQNAEVPLPDGGKVPLSGKIDRVDVYKNGDGETFLRIVDYKTGSVSFSRDEIKKGFCLQMPLYLMALCQTERAALAKLLSLPPDTEFQPAGVTYLSAKVKQEKTLSRLPYEEAMRVALKEIKRIGVILDRDDVKTAMSRSADTAMIGGGRSNAIEAVDGNGFKALFADLTAAVGEITRTMRGGSAEAESRSARSSCDYCPFAAVCRAARRTREDI